MFTGLTEELGIVKELKAGQKSGTLTLKAKKVLEDVKLGDSIAVNGVCLTVVEFSADDFAVEIMDETLKKTNLGALSSGDVVNLERALQLGTRLGGHLVSGHIDGVGKIVSKENVDIAILVKIEAPFEVMKYVLTKGSIAIDGISLTVVTCDDKSLTVSLIPHTAKETTLGLKPKGASVNLEGDMIGKYVEKFVLNQQDANKESKITLNYLQEHGFISQK